MKQIMLSDLQKYIVTDVTEEVPGVVTLSLTDTDNTVPGYTPGQYINVFFPDSEVTEGKAYSISSSPHESVFTLTVRGIGEFSNKLTSMKVGDTIYGSFPYGFFSPEKDDTDLILLAAGIGVTPFRSIIRNETTKKFPRKVTLFHSIRTSDDALFNAEFRDISNTFANFSFYQFVTREKSPRLSGAHTGRIKISELVEKLPKNSRGEFLICGSIPFTRDIWKALKENGVPEDYIYTEAFFSH